ncbi:SlyX protein [Bdellovibrio sp. ZAP7]|uniref:SlyX family protein n=1 Tax=Bdellovibrio sp. ZAP7 TaxID=2231053 RepID=UPI00115A5357|nr:SlyX family protein [Bdellovibrio sp. ZAP7]QDK45718.1 SlyX protein [Bdellovibrio sp. ZAP7]
MDESRLINLEIKISHQDQVIEELHQVVYEQQKAIEKLEVLLNGLTSRLKEALEAEGSEIRGNEKPPHY